MAAHPERPIADCPLRLWSCPQTIEVPLPLALSLLGLGCFGRRRVEGIKKGPLGGGKFWDSLVPSVRFLSATTEVNKRVGSFKSKNG